MADNGVETPDLATASALDFLIGHQTVTGLRRTRQMAVSDFVTQLLAAGPLEDAIEALVTAASAALGARNTAQGRLTLTTGVPVSVADVDAGTSIHYVPAGGSLAPIYDGASMVWRDFGSGLTLPLTSNSGYFGYHANAFPRDLFLFWNGSAVVLGTGPTWGDGAVPPSNLTIERGKGAGSTELQVVDGIITNKYAMTVRWGSGSTDYTAVAANRATYVGSFRPVANGTAADSRTRRLLYNAYNQTLRPFHRIEAATAYTYSTSAYQQMNLNTLNQVDVFFGLEGGMLDLSLVGFVANGSSTAVSSIIAIGLDSTTSPAVFSYVACVFAVGSGTARYSNSPGLGYHYFSMMQRGAGIGGQTQTWQAGSYMTGQVLI